MENKNLNKPGRIRQVENIDSVLSHPSRKLEMLEKEIFEKRLYEYLSDIIPGIATVHVRESRPWVKRRLRVFLTFSEIQDFVDVDVQQDLLYIWRFKIVVPEDIRNDEGYLKNILQRSARNI